MNGKREVLYNGIVLPDGWQKDEFDPTVRDMEPQKVPYLTAEADGGTRPDVIDVTVGRQLFVDDFLVERTDLKQTFHTAQKYEGNPIIPSMQGVKEEVLPFPRDKSSAAMVSGGLWYDMEERKFKMWYNSGFCLRLAYAESDDGIHWEYPALNADGSNLILPEVDNADSTTVWLDYEAPKEERYKLLVRISGGVAPANLYISGDGISWKRLPTDSPEVCDRTTFFYNPFRRKWVLSARGVHRPIGRLRGYVETDDFLDGWQGHPLTYWMRADDQDLPHEKWGVKPQLYNFDAVAYESIMIGRSQIWRGPENNQCLMEKFPKFTELIMAYSRDGYHFDRPDRTPFIAATDREGNWERGYLQSSGGGTVLSDREMWFYYSGFSGSYISDTGSVVKDMHAGGAVGLAKLRRDGFASLDGSGTCLTRKLTVKDGKEFLFVNVDAPCGTLRAELLDEEGRPVPGYGMEDCLGVCGDAPKAMVRWKSGARIGFLSGRVFRIRFECRDASFYSFWLSGEEAGGSGGMLAAGYVKDVRTRSISPENPTGEAGQGLSGSDLSV